MARSLPNICDLCKIILMFEESITSNIYLPLLNENLKSDTSVKYPLFSLHSIFVYVDHATNPYKLTWIYNWYKSNQVWPY